MTKVVLIGSKSCQWDIEGSMKAGGTQLVLTESELKIAEKNNLIECFIGEDKKFLHEKPTKKIKTESKPKTKKYTYEILKSMNRAQQVRILNGFGITEIPRYEGERIEAILEAEK